jgi:hypothetical protein
MWRCRGTTSEGELQIGESLDRRARLVSFLLSAVHGEGLHSADCEFWDSDFRSKPPAENLYSRCTECT